MLSDIVRVLVQRLLSKVSKFADKVLQFLPIVASREAFCCNLRYAQKNERGRATMCSHPDFHAQLVAPLDSGVVLPVALLLPLLFLQE